MSTVPEQRDQPLPLVAAFQWTSRITSIALEIALPGVIGLWLDRKLGTGFLLLVLGVILGFVAGLISLINLARQPQSDERDETKR
jgi:F0F1-type ATP synthase assembly protein I